MATSVALCVFMTLGLQVVSVSAIVGGGGIIRGLPGPSVSNIDPTDPGWGGANEEPTSDLNDRQILNLPQQSGVDGGMDAEAAMDKLAQEKQRRLEEWKRQQAEEAMKRATTTPRPRVPANRLTTRPSPVNSNNNNNNNNDASNHIIEALLKKLQDAKARPERPEETTVAPASSGGPSVATIVIVICCVTLGVTAAGVAALIAWHKCRAAKGAGERSYAVNYAARLEGVDLKVPGHVGGYPNAVYRGANEGKPPAYPYPDQTAIPALEILRQQMQLKESQGTQAPADAKPHDADANHYSQLE